MDPFTAAGLHRVAEDQRLHEARRVLVACELAGLGAVADLTPDEVAEVKRLLAANTDTVDALIERYWPKE